MPKPRPGDIAEPTISAVLNEFLAEQSSKLKPATMSKYEGTVDLLKDSINGYAYQYLDNADSKKFERLFAEGIEFCDMFGPEHILPNVDEFLSYFMVRKVIAGKETLRAAGTVTSKLAAWLGEKGYASPDASASTAKEATKAAKLLPRAEECAQLLYEFAEEQAIEATPEREFGHFTITRVEPGKLWLEGLLEEEPVGPVSVPRAVTDRCEVGWSMSLALGKKRGKWTIVEFANVYPM